MAGGLTERIANLTQQELARTLAALCEEVGAAESSILLPHGETELVFFASTNPALLQAGAPAVPINASFSGLAYRTGQTIAFADAAKQPPHFKAVDDLVGSATREFAAVPFADRNLGGVLTLVNRIAPAADSQPFGIAELRRAEAVAREMAHTVALLAELAGAAGHDQAQADPLDAELAADIALLNDAERRIVQSLASALLQNRAE